MSRASHREHGYGGRNTERDTQRQWFRATVTYSSGVSISSAEAFPTKAEAISAAAMKVLDMPDRLEEFDASNAED